MKDDERYNLFLGLGVFGIAAVLIGFVVALMGSKSGEVAAALATVISGSFVVGAATIAWRSIRQQIASQENIEIARKKTETETLESGFTSELLVYSSGVIQAASIWNQRALRNPQEQVVSNWPVFQDPLYYRTSPSYSSHSRDS